MPPKSRISNLLKNFDFLDDEKEESFDNSQGQSALDALLSKSKKKQGSHSSPSLAEASKSRGPVITPRSTSQRQIQDESKSKANKLFGIKPSKNDRSPDESYKQLNPSSRRPSEDQSRSASSRRPSEEQSRYGSVRRPSEEQSRSASSRRPSEEQSRYGSVRGPSEDKVGGRRPSDRPLGNAFDYSGFCIILKQMSFDPLFAQASGADPPFSPERDISIYNAMLEDCLQDSKSFSILPWKIYEEKKDAAIKIRSQIQKIQNTLLKSPSEADTTLMIETLYKFRDLELIVLRNVSAVLAYQVAANDSKIKDFDSELSSTKFLLKDREKLISKLEVTSKEKDDKIVTLEKRLVSKQKITSDSDTDVEDDVSSKKKANSSFSIPDRDVYELASILKSLDPSLPYPTPSNLISSLTRLKSSSTFSNVSKSEKGEYKDLYLNLEKKYNASKQKLEQYKEDISMWKNRYEGEVSKKDTTTNGSDEKHAKEIRELKASLRREAEAELTALTEEADQEMREMQESFNMRLRETENGFRKQIEDLQKNIDAQDRELKSSKVDQAKFMRQNESISNSNIQKLEEEIEERYERKIAELERRVENAGLEGAQTLERELEKLRESHDSELSSIVRQNKKEVDKAIQEGVLAKMDTQKLLYEAQATIEKIKEEAFLDKADTDKEIHSLNNQLNKLKDENEDLSDRVQHAEGRYLTQIEKLEANLTVLERENENIKELIDIEKKNSDTLKQDIKDKEVYIGELGNSLLEYQKLTKEFDTVEDRYKSELQKKDVLISSLEATIQKEKENTKLGLVDITEAKEEAVDQLDRIQRRLKATEQDLERSRLFADEKEAEIIDLKRLLRSQNKQLQTALGGEAPPTPKLSKDDLESKIEILNTQVTSLKCQLEYKEKESFEVRMEAAEAFQKAEDLDKAREEINRLKGEIDKISLSLIELKSAKVQLMERVDNAEHRETLLKNELSLLKAELERKR